MKRHIKSLLIVKLMLVSLLYGRTVLAEEELNNNYKVEVIIFKQSQIDPSLSLGQSFDNTRWPNTQTAKHFTADGNFRLLPSTELNLRKQARALDNKANYDVLLHLAWMQTIPNTTHSTSAPAVYIHGGNAYAYDGRLLAKNDNSEIVPNTFQLEPFTWELDGTLRLYQTNYININTDLVLSEPDHETGALLTYQLKQKQRTRLGELHYFDNPAFGMLIKISQ